MPEGTKASNDMQMRAILGALSNAEAEMDLASTLARPQAPGDNIYVSANAAEVMEELHRRIQKTREELLRETLDRMNGMADV